MSDDLLGKVKKAILRTGFPLELEVGAMLRRAGWVAFHTVEYTHPGSEDLRELDLLAFKLVHERRVELRISCKSSVNKQFVFFTRDRTLRIKTGDLKITPVTDSRDARQRIPEVLSRLPLFSEVTEAVNYTVLSGENVDREARALLRDALMSTVCSVHHRLLPWGGLLDDERGTVYLFIVVLRGQMYEARYDETGSEMCVSECDYVRWKGRLAIPREYYKLTVSDPDGKQVPFGDVMYWFGDRICVEFVRDTALPRYLARVEEAFRVLSPEDLTLLGKPWRPENFPRTVRPSPKLSREEDDTGSTQ